MQTLEELSREYERSIDVQSQVIKGNLDKLKKARKAMNFKEIKRLNSILCILYEEKSELEERAHQLKEYIN
ncbi:MAG: hypothetical protein NC122_05740 [Faecalibacterium sp.]|nr:hypothetical protein [Faecalibacterium sp.]